MVTLVSVPSSTDSVTGSVTDTPVAPSGTSNCTSALGGSGGGADPPGPAPDPHAATRPSIAAPPTAAITPRRRAPRELAITHDSISHSADTSAAITAQCPPRSPSRGPPRNSGPHCPTIMPAEAPAGARGPPRSDVRHTHPADFCQPYG